MNGLKLITLAAVVAIAGCSAKTTDISPAQYYRAENSQSQWKITGNLNNEFDQVFGRITRQLSVFIEGEEVINGNLSAVGTGELSGNYKGTPIDTICSSERKTRDWIEVRCMVLVDNERAATLTF